ncbi:MAG: hypothetical protein IKM49_02040, partial [Ruminococcus sp.]|nr:hypothetical protein [Ruminococcus sp.]
PHLQGFPSFKTVHRTVLKFTPCGALLKLRAFALCGERLKGFAPETPTSLLKKARAKTLSLGLN